MSATPRTDAEQYRADVFTGSGYGDESFVTNDCVDADFARQLERELAEAKEQWRMSSVCRELQARITALEAQLSAPSERIRACADDSKRLDWLEGRLGKGGFKATTSEPDGCCSLVCREVHTVEGDLRSAIDAAMADSPASPGGASR